ncbi:EAL domain-containing protein [Desulfocapsa sulfexigens DSM 10523]|uniref:EAL domain-containing protein n=1 Tax=Desulfocapsa sulfexigens (strain DSM 10523 / SB164P1) TaxID=1167006 RepID=M1PC64_DESSD|nr:EAL domain-containing protein [Desulfocapsa sulfexigens]AGF79217.1 EAL domain-containing protein [Desulfocapsa sulfexigens DSM 10523]
MGTAEKCIWYIEGGMKDGKCLDVPIHVSPFFIGRDKGCHLRVKAPGVSRKHVQLEVNGEKIFVGDMGSTNGTFVNRNKITRQVEIRSGDTIHLGQEELRITRRCDYKKNDPVADDILYNSTIMININDPMFALNDDFVQQEKEFNLMITNREVTIVFQPIVSLSECEVVGYEALGRGFRSDLPESPCDLFRIAEKLGRAKELSSVFRSRAIQTCHELPGAPLIFVNTHPVEDLTTGLQNNIEEMRRLTAPWQVVLEVHESAVTDTRMMLELKEILRDHEMYLAYDDFGAGQARWNELVEAPPDYLKFDLQLIRDIHKKTTQKQEMVRKLVDICLDQGAYPLAECVENHEELEACRHLGFTHGQGWLFGKPAEASFFAATKNKKA